jgi:hypothetical protein
LAASVFLISSSKKGISGNQLHRTLGCTLKTAGVTPVGGSGKVVEVDETFYGRLEGQLKGPYRMGDQNVVLTLVESGGSARSFHVDGVRISDLQPIVRENLSREANMMTDEGAAYKGIGPEFVSHETVAHSRRIRACGCRALDPHQYR